MRTRLRAIERHEYGPGWLALAVGAILLLNLADGMFTLLWIHTGVATEANVLLAELAEHSAVSFALVKSSLVSLGLLLLWRQRQRPLAAFGIALAFLVYNALLLYHLRICALALG